ncbi:MAG TPA: hypothetical protein VF150_12785, partial [Thermoanaerobaculia bacterium]
HHRSASGRGALRATLAPALLIPALLLVPAALPLCGMGVEACFTAAVGPTVPVGAPGDHCPMGAEAREDMPCCVTDAAPPEPTPVAPPKADHDLQVKPQIQSPHASAPSPVAAARAEALGGPPCPALAGPQVPLYTLLSSLLS